MCNGKKGKAKQIKMEGRTSRVRIIEGNLAEMQGISLLVRFNSRIQSVRTESRRCYLTSKLTLPSSVAAPLDLIW